MQSATRFFSLAIVSLLLGIGLDVQAADQASNAKPGTLTLTKIDDKTALVEARFTAPQKEKQISIFIDKQENIFVDDGTNGDVRAGDGIFTAKVAFDFDAFAKANLQLSRSTGSEKSLFFAAGDRQALGTQQSQTNSSGLSVSTVSGNKRQDFTLPLDAKLIKAGTAIPLPLIGKPLGLPTDTTFTPAAAISIPDSLMITGVNVVNDPGRTWSCPTTNTTPVGNATGEWTFWQLMENISNGSAPTSDYIKNFFKQWTVAQTVNTFSVAARPNVYQQIIKQWEIRSGGPGATLLPKESPFRLLGIVLRIDLRGGSGPYASGGAGEARFVFALHDGHCNNMSETLILEYKVPIAGCTNVRNWAQKWVNLSSSANYNNDLASLTQVFASAGANPSAPNQSAIGQVRTNELLPGSPQWELREFALPATGGLLLQTDTKQEPHISHNNSVLLANYINANWPLLVGPPAAQHTIPLSFLSTPFAAGSAPVPTLWNAPAASLTVPTTPAPVTPPPATIRDDALFQLAVNTCSGCHQMETGTPFAHLNYTSPPGSPALLSGFLTGISVPDPRNPAVMRNFNDLARRAADLNVAATMSCTKSATIGNQLVNELTSPAILKAVH